VLRIRLEIGLGPRWRMSTTVFFEGKGRCSGNIYPGGNVPFFYFPHWPSPAQVESINTARCIYEFRRLISPKTNVVMRTSLLKVS